jgi:hypothetical protein
MQSALFAPLTGTVDVHASMGSIEQIHFILAHRAAGQPTSQVIGLWYYS